MDFEEKDIPDDFAFGPFDHLADHLDSHEVDSRGTSGTSGASGTGSAGLTEPQSEPVIADADPLDLTEYQARVWRVMLSLQEIGAGRPATQADISKACGFRSSQGCLAHYEALARKGYIVCVAPRGQWRSWYALRSPVSAERRTPFQRYLNKPQRRRIVPVERNFVPKEEVALSPRALSSALAAELLTDFVEPDLDSVHVIPVRPGEPTVRPFSNKDCRVPDTDSGLTERQIAVWKVVYGLQRHLKRPPLQVEVSQLLGITSPQGVRTHYNALSRAGYMASDGKSWYATSPD
jgi:SOS-response transcriptional repressor LexA